MSENIHFLENFVINNASNENTIGPQIFLKTNHQAFLNT